MGTSFALSEFQPNLYKSNIGLINGPDSKDVFLTKTFEWEILGVEGTN
jgi:hypothetical protein